MVVRKTKEKNQLLKKPGWRAGRTDQKPEDGSYGPAKGESRVLRPDNIIQSSLTIKYKHAMFLPWGKIRGNACE